MAFVKWARYTALTADKLAGHILELTAKLEDRGILLPTRPSRFARDKKLRTHGADVAKSDQEIADLVKLIPNHPDAENLVRSLFRDLHVPPFKLHKDESVHNDDENERLAPLPEN
jgi:hypothetical protein